ncbi:MAG: Dabb family protein [Muribaculaceae bacterium]|nr:Dabb family protein [Muribaculaceae bacterium]
MIKHVFIAPVKPGVAEEAVVQRIAAMKLLADKVPGVEKLTIGRTLGLYGSPNAVLMEIDLRDAAAWSALLSNKYHAELNATAGEVFDTDGFIGAQIEF